MAHVSSAGRRYCATLWRKRSEYRARMVLSSSPMKISSGCCHQHQRCRYVAPRNAGVCVLGGERPGAGTAGGDAPRRFACGAVHLVNLCSRECGVRAQGRAERGGGRGEWTHDGAALLEVLADADDGVGGVAQHADAVVKLLEVRAAESRKRGVNTRGTRILHARRGETPMPACSTHRSKYWATGKNWGQSDEEMSQWF